MFGGGMSRLLRWFATPPLLLLAVAALMTLAAACRSHGSATNASPLFPYTLPGFLGGPWLIAGLAFAARAGLAFFLRRLGKGNPLAFIDTLEHELTHALFGYLTLNPPLSLKASLDGDGEVLLKGQNVFTLLAPYFFPLWMSLSTLITVFLDAQFRAWGLTLTLALFGSFAFRLLAEFRWRQTDLQAYGFFFSTGLVFTLLALCLGMLFALLHLCPWTWLWSLPQRWLLLIQEGYGLLHRAYQRYF